MEAVFLSLARTRMLPAAVRLAGATSFVLIAFGMHWVLFGPDAPNPYLLFFPAVFLTGLVFDHGSSIYAALLGTVLAFAYFVLPLEHTHAERPAEIAAATIFFVSSLACTLLLESMHKTCRRLVSANADLAAANRRLALIDEEKELSLRASVHRSRNDLHRLAAMLRLQRQDADEAAREALTEAEGRVLALAAVNGRLDAKPDGEEGGVVDSRVFLEGLVQDLHEAAVGLRPLLLLAEAESWQIPTNRAVPLGLIVSELVGSALRHAFPNERAGILRVQFRREGAKFLLCIEDDGEAFDPHASPRGAALGLRFARALAAQLGGQLDIARRDGGGTLCTLRFPSEVVVSVHER